VLPVEQRARAVLAISDRTHVMGGGELWMEGAPAELSASPTRARLRERVARNGRSIEAEVRAILHELLDPPPSAGGLGTRIHARFRAGAQAAAAARSAATAVIVVSDDTDRVGHAHQRVSFRGQAGTSTRSAPGRTRMRRGLPARNGAAQGSVSPSAAAGRSRSTVTVTSRQRSWLT
jgi:hypothetical protein